ncbi:MAG: leucyl/phenylalanyl-tRNA--protein transferase [Chitinophagaceae bacterium]
MPFFLSDNENRFPPVHLADADGILALGGDLSTERLLLAYRSGIFPWYDGETIIWWAPDPRFVLFPEELKISRSFRSFLQKNDPGSGGFEWTVNRAFPEVIKACREIKRPGQSGTWITPEVEKAYVRLHELGYAHSAETWQDGRLIGGLYGIRMGNVFFGESMFSRQSQASRFAFVNYVSELQKEGVQLIDCQVYTDYLKSFGARMISRDRFSRLLQKWIPSTG